ncbi:MAG: acyl-CoA dehydrogenase family protein [Burkholderiaceae bacterium]
MSAILQLHPDAPAVRAGFSEPDRLVEQVRELTRTKLVGQADSIDADGAYPEAFMRELGAIGAYAPHMSPAAVNGGAPDLETTIRAMSVVGQTCLSTAFSYWCQTALGWYVASTDNEALRAELLEPVADGSVLGGTGLSNPMKTFFGIEKLLLRGERVDGGWRVSGRLPWVSNLGAGHAFGIVFEDTRDAAHRVMAIVDCDSDGLAMFANDRFLALGGTRTFGLAFKDVFVPEARIAADPMEPFLPRIRAGFILLQAGMAFGMIESCIDMMLKLDKPLGHVNCHLGEQPGQFEEELSAMKETVFELCRTPYDDSRGYFASVIRARLMAGEVSVRAAHALMLHSGARGYVTGAVAQRRLREAYFIAIVTPATKQLRKMLADMGEPVVAVAH